MAKSKTKLRQHYALKKGLPPGTLRYVGDFKNFDIRIEQITYNEQQFAHQYIKAEKLLPDEVNAPVRWINISGIHQSELISRVGKIFNIHPLVLEDIMHTEQRPKLEEYEHYIYIVLRMIGPNEKNGEMHSEQVSLLIFQNTVITFQENPEDIFDNLRERIRKSAGIIRKSNAAYLAYCLLDTIVDYYFVVLEQIGEKLEEAESQLIEQHTTFELNQLHQYKRELIFMRKSIWPLREVINYLSKGEAKIIGNDISIYFRDVYDHCIQMLDTLESYRDLTSGLMDLHLTSLSNKLNQVMKTLTIIATIFIPLTFIVGVYGMNFEYMPELNYRSGYFIVWGIMLVVAGGMVWYFKKRKWF